MLAAPASRVVVLAQAVSDNPAFLTRDMDLSNILLFPPANYLGIIVLKIKPHNIDSVHNLLASALGYFTQDSIRQALIIVDQNKFRERR